jgi:2-polyprenyl-3-methyl-5-hydroxy-6-metoxy-1,4-benzoquinol methylase
MKESYDKYPCDLCGSTDAVEIPCAREYTGNQPIHVCKNCGLVYVSSRRPTQRIADVWSEEIYETRSDQNVANSVSYSSSIPAVTARLTFVAEVLKSEIKLSDKRLCDVGAGEGHFLELIRQREPSLSILGIEPSENNCRLMESVEIPCFYGTIERFLGENEISEGEKFDVTTIMWTLENCFSARTMLDGANSILRDDGYVVVATGSRILVPFKKPLDYYLGGNPSDSHAFRFSAKTLKRYLEITGFEVIYQNRFIDHDVLCMIGKKSAYPPATELSEDDYVEVLNFFDRWHKETIDHFPS